MEHASATAGDVVAQVLQGVKIQSCQQLRHYCQLLQP